MHRHGPLLVGYMLHLCVILTRYFVMEASGGPLREGVGGCEGVRADATGYPGGMAVSKTSQHRHGKATRTRSTPTTRWYEKQINCSPALHCCATSTHLKTAPQLRIVGKTKMSGFYERHRRGARGWRTRIINLEIS